MSCSYKVRIQYVDDTYWDDGSRWTSQFFPFQTRKAAIAFARTAVSDGCEVRGQRGTLLVRPDRSNVTVIRTSVTEVDWTKDE